MKTDITKAEAQKQIDRFFAQKELDADQIRKIRRLAMHFKIKLGEHRKRFCKKCLHDLRGSKIRISKSQKTVECKNCGYKNRQRMR